MPQLSVAAFLELVEKSGVVDAGRLQAYLERLRGGDSLPEDAAMLAERMKRDGLLSGFQAENLLRGRWRGFFIGKYKVLELLGSGGMGAVYLAEHKIMKRRVALKVLGKGRGNEPAAIERFHREAKAVAVLDHPNIVRAYDFDHDQRDGGEERHFIVMEYVDGIGLQEMVKQGGPLPWRQAAGYIAQAARGLEHAHAAGLVHRDIKPGNLLVDRSGVVKLLDLGLARFFQEEDKDPLTRRQEETVLGTADYLAPEQAVDSHAVDTRADIYSLGCTFYYLLTGKCPFEEGTTAQKLIWHQTRRPKSISEFRRDVPEGLLAVIEKMMAKKPADRHQTPTEVIAALAPWIPPELLAGGPPLTSSSPHLSVAGEPQARSAISSAALAVPAAGQTASETAPETSDLAPSTAPLPARPADLPASAASTFRRDVVLPERKRSKPARVGIMIAGGLLLAVGGAAAIYFRIKDRGPGLVQPAPTAPAPDVATPQIHVPATLHVSKGKTQEGDFGSLAEALRRALPGDRIVIRDQGVYEEQLVLQAGAFGKKDLTIEGHRDADGRSPVLRSPSHLSAADELLIIQNVEGLTIRGLTLDGGNATADLVRISGPCPGLTLEGLELKGFTRAGIVLEGAQGYRGREIQLVDLLVTPAPAKGEPAASGLSIQGPPRVLQAASAYVILRGSRFSGPLQAAVRLRMPLLHGLFERNLFVHNKRQAILYPADGAPSSPFSLRLANNTFFDCQEGLSLQQTPRLLDSSIEVQSNLFYQVRQGAVMAEAATLERIKSQGLLQGAGNIYDAASSKAGNGDQVMGLSLRGEKFTLPTARPRADDFLRFAKDSPLATAGAGGVPVGALPPR